MKTTSAVPTRLLSALLLVLALVASACAGGDDDTASEAPAAEPTVRQAGDRGDAESEFAPSDQPAEEAGDNDLFGGPGPTAAEAPAAPQGDAEGEFDDTGRSSSDGAAGALGAEAPAAESSGGLFTDDEVSPEPTRNPDTTGTRFEDYGIRDFVDTERDPLSTFALDVDTGSYSIARQWLNSGSTPPRESVRVEEYVNAFDYGYDDPNDALGLTIDGAPSPFDDDNYLVRIGVQSERIDDEDRPDASLTFVIDTSGSMSNGGRLELVKQSLEELVDELGRDDTVAIVEFDDNPSVVLEPTDVDDADRILDALDRLTPGGSTNVEGGLALGYDLAAEMFDDDRVNRVILLSDGVANVGLTDPDGLAEMIRRDADRGVQLLTIGVGMGNFNDVLMEQLADQGDGFYAYVDTEDEAERLFEDNLTATLVTMAIDAKIQVEFDDQVVEEYRLIGFENRGVRDSDFRNNDVDAGEVGAGHQVTALYEIRLQRGVDVTDRDELGEVRLRWEAPGTGKITELEEDIDLRMIHTDWDDADDSLKLAVIAASFAEVLRDSPFADHLDLRDIAEAAEELADDTRNRDVEELADLIRIAA